MADRETAWLVERHYNSTLHYYCPGPGAGWIPWTTEANAAMRFARREDAELALHHLCDDVGRVAEHMWIDGKEAPRHE